MSAPTHYRRLGPKGGEIDGKWLPIDAATCSLIAPVWVLMLERCEYAGIWLLLANGQEVFVKRRPAKVLNFTSVTTPERALRMARQARALPTILSGAVEANSTVSLMLQNATEGPGYHYDLDRAQPRPEAGDAV